MNTRLPVLKPFSPSTHNVGHRFGKVHSLIDPFATSPNALHVLDRKLIEITKNPLVRDWLITGYYSVKGNKQPVAVDIRTDKDSIASYYATFAGEPGRFAFQGKGHIQASTNDVLVEKLGLSKNRSLSFNA